MFCITLRDFNNDEPYGVLGPFASEEEANRRAREITDLSTNVVPLSLDRESLEGNRY